MHLQLHYYEGYGGALQSNMIKVAASGTVSYLHASHTKSRALRVRNVPKWLLRIQANPIQYSTLFACSNRYASHVGPRNTEVYG